MNFETPQDEMELAEMLAELHVEHAKDSCGQPDCDVCADDLAEAVNDLVDEIVNGDANE